MTCPEKAPLIQTELNRVLTQYRESPMLLGLIDAYLDQVADALIATCEIPSFFDIDSSTYDQLTLIGKMLGWPRCHCICETTPVFGYACGGYSGPFELVGYCEGGTRVGCGAVGAGEICIDDDLYRRFLKVRRYQILTLYDIASLTECVQLMWGEDASVIEAGSGQVVLSPGRALSDQESTLLPLVFRVMPIAPGIKGLFHETTGPVFGYGTGWGGYCESTGVDAAERLCPTDPHAYACA